MLTKLHNHLLNKSILYSRYHSTRYHKHIHWGIFGLTSTILSLKVLAVILTISFISLLPITQSLAASLNKTWDSQADWNGWTKTNTVNTSDGKLELANSSRSSIGVRSHPYNIAITPNGSFAYVTNFGDNTVSVIDTSTNTVVGSPIAVGNKPQGIAITSNGSFVYVTNYFGNTVSVIDTSTNTVVGSPIAVGVYPYNVAITPNGSFAYVTNYADNTVSVIDTSTNTVVGSPITVGNQPFDIAITPNGSFAYVVNFHSNTVSVISTSTNAVVGSPIGVGRYPIGIAINSNGSFAYVTNSIDNTVSVISTSTNAIIGSPIGVGYQPEDIAITPNGSFVYTTNYADYTVSVINTSTNTIVGSSIEVGNNPIGIAITPNGSFAYITNYNSNTVSVIDTATNTIVTFPIYAPSGSATISFTPAAGVTQHWVSATSSWATPANTAGNLQYSSDNSTWVSDITIVPDSVTLYIKASLATTDTSVTPSLNSLSLDYTTATITTTSPNGGETYYYSPTQNLTQPITYSTTGAISGDHIHLQFSSDSGAIWTDITGATNLAYNSSSYTWTLPQVSTTQARIKSILEDSSNNEISSDASDNNFTLKPKTITVVAPNGGETFYYSQNKNFTQPITWSVDGATASDHIQLQYSSNNGTTWSDIPGATNLPYSDTSYTWTLPKTATTEAKIRVVLKDSGGDELSSDPSDNTFTLKPMQINLANPITSDCYLVGPGNTIGGCATTQGLTKIITWTTQGANEADHIKLEYSTNSGSTWTTLATSLTNTDLSYTWNLPTNVKTTQAQLRATLEGGSNLNLAQGSTGDFTIHANTKPTITPTDPSDGVSIN